MADWNRGTYAIEGEYVVAEYRGGYPERKARLVEAPPENVQVDTLITLWDGVKVRTGWTREPGIRQSRCIAWKETV